MEGYQLKQALEEADKIKKYVGGEEGSATKDDYDVAHELLSEQDERHQRVVEERMRKEREEMILKIRKIVTAQTHGAGAVPAPLARAYMDEVASPEGVSETRIDVERVDVRQDKFIEKYGKEAVESDERKAVLELGYEFDRKEEGEPEIPIKHITGRLAEAFFNRASKGFLGDRGNVQPTSLYDDYLNRTDSVVHLGYNNEVGKESPLLLYVDIVSGGDVEGKMRPKTKKGAPDKPLQSALLQGIKYYDAAYEERGNERLVSEVDKFPRVVVMFDIGTMVNLADLLRRDEAGFNRVAGGIIFAQVFQALGAHKNYIASLPISQMNQMDKNRRIKNYDGYISKIKGLLAGADLGSISKEGGTSIKRTTEALKKVFVEGK